MQLRSFVIAALFSVSLPSFASSTVITPGQTVIPGMISIPNYPNFMELAGVNGTFYYQSGTYSETVASDTSNPFCSGCLDFILEVTNGDSGQDVTSVSVSSFKDYSLQVAYAVGGSPGVAPQSATVNQAGDVSFGFDNFGPNDDSGASGYNGESDYLFIFTNAKSYTNGDLTIATSKAPPDDPAGFAPSGPAVSTVTPEPSSLILMGTGVLGLAGLVRRRIA